MLAQPGKWNVVTAWLRARFRWSLRSFLVACVLAGPLSAWLAESVHFSGTDPVPILGPIVQSNEKSPPPTEEEILRAASRASAELTTPEYRPWTVVRQRVGERLDDARQVPLIGAACLHHRFYLCLVMGTLRGAPRVDVLCVDHNYFDVAASE